jgi:pilus assembly protein CpaE
MEGRRAPQGLEAEDRIALGLTAQHLAYLLVASLAAYAMLTSHLPGILKYPAATLVAGLGALLAWGRLAHRPLDSWFWLGARYLARPRRSPAVVAAPPVEYVAPPTAVAAVEAVPASGDVAPATDEFRDRDEDVGRILTLHRDGDAPNDYPEEAPPGQVRRSDVTPVFIGTTQRIAFFALKGGAGKTTLACEVAALLARDGRHRVSADASSEGLRVALLDIDLGAANVSMRVGLSHPTLWDLVIDPNPDVDGIEDCLLVHEETGLRVLLGPPRAIASPETRAIAIQRIAQVLSYLDQHNYHFVFIDLAGEINELTTYVLEAAHRVYYVLTPTASGVQDTYRGVETLRRLGHRAKLRFVVNQGREGFDPSEMLSDLGGELAASVGRDDAFVVAEDEHRPASLSPGEARTSIGLLATTIYPGFVDLAADVSVWRRLRQRLG